MVWSTADAGAAGAADTGPATLWVGCAMAGAIVVRQSTKAPNSAANFLDIGLPSPVRAGRYPAHVTRSRTGSGSRTSRLDGHPHKGPRPIGRREPTAAMRRRNPGVHGPTCWFPRPYTECESMVPNPFDSAFDEGPVPLPFGRCDESGKIRGHDLGRRSTPRPIGGRPTSTPVRRDLTSDGPTTRMRAMPGAATGATASSRSRPIRASACCSNPARTSWPGIRASGSIAASRRASPGRQRRCVATCT